MAQKFPILYSRQHDAHLLAAFRDVDLACSTPCGVKGVSATYPFLSIKSMVLDGGAGLKSYVPGLQIWTVQTVLSYCKPKGLMVRDGRVSQICCHHFKQQGSSYACHKDQAIQVHVFKTRGAVAIILHCHRSLLKPIFLSNDLGVFNKYNYVCIFTFQVHLIFTRYAMIGHLDSKLCTVTWMAPKGKEVGYFSFLQCACVSDSLVRTQCLNAGDYAKWMESARRAAKDDGIVYESLSAPPDDHASVGYHPIHWRLGSMPWTG
eukprot:1154828-Pelagomonas_calceolata.AAC.2